MTTASRAPRYATARIISAAQRFTWYSNAIVITIPAWYIGHRALRAIQQYHTWDISKQFIPRAVRWQAPRSTIADRSIINAWERALYKQACVFVEARSSRCEEAEVPPIARSFSRLTFPTRVLLLLLWYGSGAVSMQQRQQQQQQQQQQQRAAETCGNHTLYVRSARDASFTAPTVYYE